MVVKVGKSLGNFGFLVDKGKRLVWRQNKEENSSFGLLFWAVISNPRTVFSLLELFVCYLTKEW
jgi:hypothetical protein